MKFKDSYLSFGFLAFVFSFIPHTVSAVGVDFNGYFRTNYTFHYNLDLDRDAKPNARNYADFRFRLDPTFFITEKIRIKTSLNVMDGAVGNTNFRGLPFDNPATNNSRTLNNTNTGSPVGKPMTSDEMSSWVYGGAYAPDAAMESAGVGPVQLRRAWLEYESPFGILKAGRMPVNFGKGIVANAGDGVDQQIGTTRDRLQFETAFGSYYLAPSISWFYEGLLDRGADDVYEFAFNMGRRSGESDLGLNISFIGQANADGAATNGSLANGDSKFWTLDFYGQNRFNDVEIAGEVALYTGKYVGLQLLAINGALHAKWYVTEKFNFMIEGGYSSGTSDGDIASRDLKTIPFNRDYNVSYILFEQAVPGGINRAGTAPYAPHSGAVSNAVYGRGHLQFKWVRWYHPEIQLLVPFALAKPAGASGKFYGIEYNFINKFPFDDYLTGEFVFAHFLPMSYFGGITKKHSTFMTKAGISVKF